MKPLAILGALLILFGIGTLAYNVIPIHHREEVAKIGPITATEDKEKDIFIPPVAAVLAILAGGAMVFAAGRT
jgi:hypothetical protein